MDIQEFKKNLVKSVKGCKWEIKDTIIGVGQVDGFPYTPLSRVYQYLGFTDIPDPDKDIQLLDKLQFSESEAILLGRALSPYADEIFEANELRNDILYIILSHAR